MHALYAQRVAARSRAGHVTIFPVRTEDNRKRSLRPKAVNECFCRYPRRIATRRDAPRFWGALLEMTRN